MLAHLLPAAFGDASFAKTLILRVPAKILPHSAMQTKAWSKVRSSKALMQIAHDCHTQLLTTRTVIPRL